MRHDATSHHSDPSRQHLMEEAQRLLAEESERLRAWSAELQEKLRHLRRDSLVAQDQQVEDDDRAAAEVTRPRRDRHFSN